METGNTASNGLSTHLRDKKTLLGVCFVSIVYFADIFLRASRKPFWFDELFTVYLCRLPSFHATWAAVQHGADFNPPLFYAFARGARLLFGEGPVASRTPEMFGVWIFGLCLFFFVSRRLGPVPGIIAATFPFFTLAQYYAYEARPHGITLAWCGLALVSWQRVVESPSRLLWNMVFMLSLCGGVLTHVYAVYLLIPFAVFEAYSFVRLKTIHWGIVAAFVISMAIAIPVYLPMTRAYKQINHDGSVPPSFVFSVLRHFATEMLGDSIYVLLLFLAMGAFAALAGSSKQTVAKADGREGAAIVPRAEVVLAICLLFMPVFGIAGTVFTHARFFDRYFLSSVAGVAILLGYASCLLATRTALQPIFAGCMFFLMCGDLASVVMNAARGRGDLLIEPSSKTAFSVLHDSSLDQDAALIKLKPELPILDVDGLKYLYLFYYAPASLNDRLYYASPTANDFVLQGYRRLEEGTHAGLKTTLFEDFFTSHDHFYVLNNPVSACGLCLQEVLSRGYTLKSVEPSSQGDIYEYQR